MWYIFLKADTTNSAFFVRLMRWWYFPNKMTNIVWQRIFVSLPSVENHLLRALLTPLYWHIQGNLMVWEDNDMEYMYLELSQKIWDKWLSSSQNSTEKQSLKIWCTYFRRWPMSDTPVVLTIQIYVILGMFCRTSRNFLSSTGHGFKII